MHYFDELQERIRQIRLSERVFYQKIKDFYTTSIDYNPKDEKTIEFFKIVQNKLFEAVSQPIHPGKDRQLHRVCATAVSDPVGRKQCHQELGG